MAYKARQFGPVAADHAAQDEYVVGDILRYLESNPLSLEEFSSKYPHYSTAVLSAVRKAIDTARILNEREAKT